MATFVIVQKADNKFPKSDGLTGAIVVAADEAAARAEVKAMRPGDPDGSWDAAGADAYNLANAGTFTAGEVQFTLIAPVIPFAV